jgi:hypothetical protein
MILLIHQLQYFFNFRKNLGQAELPLKLRSIRISQITERLLEVISKVTGIEQNNRPVIICVGLGRAMIKYYNEVLVFYIYHQLNQ